MPDPSKSFARLQQHMPPTNSPRAMREILALYAAYDRMMPAIMDAVAQAACTSARRKWSTDACASSMRCLAR